MESKRQSKKERQPFLPREQRRPGGQREPAEGGFSPLFLSHPVSLSPHPHPGPASVVNAARLSASPSSRVSRSGSLSALPASASLCGSRPRPAQKQARSGAGPFPRSPSNWKDLLFSQGPHPLTAMTSLPTTSSPGALPGEELMTTPILQAPEALSPEAEASTALIAVVITVVFLTLLSVVIFIFFYLYKNKGSYVTYEPAEGEPGAILQMESDSAKDREKEEYFI
ncbi:small cell adhesion glycoprotein isoform X3 [Elephas maximus indicus]|uniref:small cell adhesion glycoprotein isoform X3 n=1 Tax=Elephas maximus indicus TaxID=99487 RepID=UPI00211678AE|nr:small cell adhesion glycoprotein isoform X3 [Elephas maximus indicus]